MKKVKISYYFKDYFTFSRAERNGIIFLFVLLILLLGSNYLIPKFFPARAQGNFAEFQKAIDSLYNQDTTKKTSVHAVYTPKNVQSLNNSHQVKKIIEINTSDSAEFTTLPGIGPVFASRIIKYRRLLGGFYSTNQLMEVYGMKTDNLDKAKPFLKVDPTLIKRILVDTASFRTLVHHPYIGKDRTYKIFKLKKGLKDEMFSTGDLKSSGIFDSLQWEKVKPYFLFVKNP